MNGKSTKSLARVSKLPVALGALTVLTLAGAAAAEWKVADDKARQDLSASRAKLGEIYSQQAIGQAKKSGDPVADPEQKIEKGSMTLTTGLERCKNANENQKANCEEIAKIENSQYLYMVKMFEITAKRQERLDELEDQRKGMSASTDYGKMQDNTNQLTALYARMSLDRAQMESANFAYETRLRYLKQAQTEQTQNRMSGKTAGEGESPFGDATGLVSSVAAGATLKLTLDALQSDEPEGYDRLDWL